MQNIESLPTINAKLTAASKCGYTGCSLLNRLHHLYQFDTCQDLVRDVMHTVPMNSAKKVFKRILESVENKEEITESLKAFPLSRGLNLIILFPI